MRKSILWIALIVLAGALLFIRARHTSPTAPTVTRPVATEAPLVTDAPAAAPVNEAEAPVVKAPAQPTAVPNNAVSPVDLKIQKAFETARPVFRQKAAIAAGSNENVHNTPRQTLQAAQQLGAIVELQAQHPEQAASFRAFYLDCAKDEATITVIRSQCLDHYVKLANMEPSRKAQFLSAFPTEVTTLYETLQ